jgi:hypothetical protein
MNSDVQARRANLINWYKIKTQEKFKWWLSVYNLVLNWNISFSGTCLACVQFWEDWDEDEMQLKLMSWFMDFFGGKTLLTTWEKSDWQLIWMKRSMIFNFKVSTKTSSSLSPKQENIETIKIKTSKHCFDLHRHLKHWTYFLQCFSIFISLVQANRAFYHRVYKHSNKNPRHDSLWPKSFPMQSSFIAICLLCGGFSVFDDIKLQPRRGRKISNCQ